MCCFLDTCVCQSIPISFVSLLFFGLPTSVSVSLFFSLPLSVFFFLSAYVCQSVSVSSFVLFASLRLCLSVCFSLFLCFIFVCLCPSVCFYLFLCVLFTSVCVSLFLFVPVYPIQRSENIIKQPYHWKQIQVKNIALTTKCTLLILTQLTFWDGSIKSVCTSQIHERKSQRSASRHSGV